MTHWSRRLIVTFALVLALCVPAWLAIPAQAQADPLAPYRGQMRGRIDLEAALATLDLPAHYQRIVGTDDRQRVADTTRFPFSAIALLIGQDAAGRYYGCTASIIGVNVALTAAQCIYDPQTKGFANDILIIPGADVVGGKLFAPFGVAQAAQAFVPRGWIDSGGNELYDYGLVLLDRAVGMATGTLAPVNLSLSSLASGAFRYVMLGYPADKEIGTQWGMVAQGFTNVSEVFLGTDADITVGMSGAPLLSYQDLSIVGIMLFQSSTSNVARRVNSDFLTMLHKICADNGCTFAQSSTPGTGVITPAPQPTPLPIPQPTPTPEPSPQPTPAPSPQPQPTPQPAPSPQPAPGQPAASALAAAAQPAQPIVNPNCLYFSQTRHNLCSGFLGYWRQFGGLALFGYPLTEEYTDPQTGLVTQWFERARFEWHPGEFPQRYDVLLGLLGNELTQSRRGEPAFQRFQPRPGCRFFPETGHNLCGGFLAYWEQNGGLATFGFPISEELQEVNPDTGKVYTVQYFERERFEWHPGENPQQFDVLLGRLGAQLLAVRLNP